jgi:hypothetical protein
MIDTSSEDLPQKWPGKVYNILTNFIQIFTNFCVKLREIFV